MEARKGSSKLQERGHPGLRGVGHDRDPCGALVAGRWVPVRSASALKCTQVTLSSSSDRATAKPVLVLLPVLGLTWVCGVLVHLSIIWAYVFIALNSLQVSPVPGGRSPHGQAGSCGFLGFSLLYPS